MSCILNVLTVANPYPHLFFLPKADPDHKRVENRSWPTSYRGTLYIHAGKDRAWLRPGDEQKYPLVWGAIVGAVDLVDCITIDEARRRAKSDPEKWGWIATHAHASGPYCWIVENPRRVRAPVPWAGAQRIWQIAATEFRQRAIEAIANAEAAAKEAAKPKGETLYENGLPPVSAAANEEPTHGGEAHVGTEQAVGPGDHDRT